MNSNGAGRDDGNTDPDLNVGEHPELEDEAHPKGEILAGHGSDPPLPISPARRRTAGIVAFLFIAVILTFLIWFIASNTARRSTGGVMMGWISYPAGLMAPV